MSGVRPFIVKGGSGLRSLPRWLKHLKCNTYNISQSDIINVGREDRRGSYIPQGYVVIKKESLLADTIKVIKETCDGSGVSAQAPVQELPVLPAINADQVCRQGEG